MKLALAIIQFAFGIALFVYAVMPHGFNTAGWTPRNATTIAIAADRR